MNASPPAPSDKLLRLDRAALLDFLKNAFPPAAQDGFGEVIAVAPGHVRMRLDPTAEMLRPGNIVSGPTLMRLADVAAYALVLAHIGAVPMAVTHSLNIAFLRGCRVAPVLADARLLKLGRRLATVDIRIWQDDAQRPVAQATVGYALPKSKVA